jgi:hypothetical protein
MTGALRKNVFSLLSPAGWGMLGSLAFFFLLAKPIFRDYFTRPNDMMYSFGGDALALYFNTAYHARYGEGLRLSGTNYPDGEYIYLTDAQGVLSNGLQMLRRLGFDVSAYAVGIVNGANLYLLFAAVAVVYALLLTLGCAPLTAAVFSPLLVLLSPQVIRMGGHFGLAYPVAIPLAMLWFVRKYRLKRRELRDIGFFAVMLLFTYNNPYVGFAMSLPLVFAGGLLLPGERFRAPYWFPALSAITLGLGCLLWVFVDFRLFDPVDDRVSPQWGFFYYQARFEGLFYPPGSLLHELLKDWGFKVPTSLDFETQLNVGLAATAALVVGISALLFYRQARRVLPAPHVALVGAAILMAVIAANTGLLPVSERWVEDHLGWLLMFKAAARLAWPLYFALTLTAVRIIDVLFRAISPAWAGLFFIGVTAEVWHTEIRRYMAPRFERVFCTQYFHPKQEEEVLSVLRESRISPSDFQAILAVPRFAVWSDKVSPDIPFEPFFWGMRLSLATGLPLVNPVLSRLGTRHAMERVQMFAHPLVERELCRRFPNPKDLLLLVAPGEQVLQTGERYLKEIAEPLAETPRYTLYRLRLAALAQSPALEVARRLYTAGYRQEPLVHLSFDEAGSAVAFYGKGSRRCARGEEEIYRFSSPFDRDTTLVFSAWNYADAGRWSAGLWRLRVRDASGSEIWSENIESRKSNDVQGRYWFRVEKEIYLPSQSTLSVAVYSDKSTIVDEVMLWPKGSRTLVAYPEEDGFLIDNFWVRKPSDNCSPR